MTTSNALSTNKLSMVALLVIAGAFLAPQPVSAETRTSAGAQQIRVEFKYKKAAPADRIYSDFKRTAHMACKDDFPSPISLRKMQQECTADLVDAAVAKLGRADVAQLHHGRLAQVAAR